MRVRAVAAPSPDSNAIGPVELECTNQGLHLKYLGVGAFREGFAPGALTSGTHVLVPWQSVTEVRLHRDHVFLGIEPRLTPLNRLALAHFSDEQQGAPQERQRRRRWLRLLGGSAAISAGLLITLQLPRWAPGMGAFAAGSWGLITALLTLLAYAAAEKLWFPEPRSSEEVQREFIHALRLFRPVSVGAVPGATDAPRPLDWNQVIAQLPRSTLAIIITLSATGIAFVLTAARFASSPTDTSHAQRVPVERQSVLVAAPAVAPSFAIGVPNTRSPAELPTQPAPGGDPAADQVAAPPAQACECKRADSILWDQGFPRLSTLLISSANRAHKDHVHLELELGVVNNSSEAIPEVNLMVQFFEDEGRTAMKERPLHYAGPLRPGQAVKWHVEARGTSFLVHNPIREVLSATGAYAPAAEFAELLKANHRPVRLHGAMMLAFLGDARARAGAAKLQEALRESEQPYLERVLQAQGDMISCDWRAATEGRVRRVSACVFNTSSVTQKGLAVRVRGLDRPFDHRSPVSTPPQVLVEQTWPVPFEVPSKTGQTVEFSLDTTNPEGKVPVGFEFLVDRAERLP